MIVSLFVLAAQEAKGLRMRGVFSWDGSDDFSISFQSAFRSTEGEV